MNINDTSSSGMLDLPFSINSKLNRYLMKQQWSSAIRCLKTKKGRHHACTSDENGMSSLTIALINKPPVVVVQALLEVEPSLSCRIDRNGMTALHIACLFGSSSDVIELLIKNDDGRTASALDFSRKVPLHYSAEYICHPVDNFQSLFLDMYNSGTSISSKKNTNSKSSLPLVKCPSKSSAGSISTKSRRTKRRSSVGSSGGTVISMGQDHFKDQVSAIQHLLSVAPKSVHCPDIHGNTPLDILHDCKAEYAQGPKWERADIVSELFREISIALYKHQKDIWERKGSAVMDDALSDKSCGNTLGGSSGMTSLSALEIGQLSLTHMDLSVYSKEHGQERVPMLEKYLKGGRLE